MSLTDYLIDVSTGPIFQKLCILNAFGCRNISTSVNLEKCKIKDVKSLSFTSIRCILLPPTTNTSLPLLTFSKSRDVAALKEEHSSAREPLQGAEGRQKELEAEMDRVMQQMKEEMERMVRQKEEEADRVTEGLKEQQQRQLAEAEAREESSRSA